MSLVSLIVTLVVIGVILWAINELIPMAPPIKKIINVLVVVFVVLWLLSAFGLMPNLGAIRIGR